MQALEIEFKNMLTRVKYEKLKTTLFNDVAPIIQTNFYIDTATHDFIQHKISLRIRDTSDNVEMTLKVPQQIGVMEYNSNVHAHLLDEPVIKRSDIPNHILEALNDLNIQFEELFVIGALATERREMSYNDGLLVLDFSQYLDREDFELEYEVSDFESGQTIFNEFLKTHHIPTEQSQNKVKRFFNRYYELSKKL